MKNCILFDFDGTLIDSQVLYDIAASKSLSKLNPKYTMEFCTKTFNGRGWKDVFLEIEQLEPQHNVKQALNEALIIAKELTKNQAKPLQNAKTVLKKLQKEGKNLAICSNSSFRAITEHLALCGLEGFFAKEAIFSLESVKNSKPAPDIYLKAMNHFGEKAENCLIIEDSIAGLKSAFNAGIEVLLYKGGSHHKKNPDNSKNILATLKDFENNTLKGEIDDLIEIFDHIKC